MIRYDNVYPHEMPCKKDTLEWVVITTIPLIVAIGIVLSLWYLWHSVVAFMAGLLIGVVMIKGIFEDTTVLIYNDKMGSNVSCKASKIEAMRYLPLRIGCFTFLLGYWIPLLILILHLK